MTKQNYPKMDSYIEISRYLTNISTFQNFEFILTNIEVCRNYLMKIIDE